MAKEREKQQPSDYDKLTAEVDSLIVKLSILRDKQLADKEATIERLFCLVETMVGKSVPTQMAKLPPQTTISSAPGTPTPVTHFGVPPKKLRGGKNG